MRPQITTEERAAYLRYQIERLALRIATMILAEPEGRVDRQVGDMRAIAREYREVCG